MWEQVEAVPGNALCMMFANNELERKTAALLIMITAGRITITLFLSDATNAGIQTDRNGNIAHIKAQSTKQRTDVPQSY